MIGCVNIQMLLAASPKQFCLNLLNCDHVRLLRSLARVLLVVLVAGRNAPYINKQGHQFAPVHA